MVEDDCSVGSLCSRLAEIKDVYLPAKHNDGNDSKEEEKILSVEEKSAQLQTLFSSNPVKFLQSYHSYIKPREVSCFNTLPDSEEVEFYIRKICHKQDMMSRTEIDSSYLSHTVKNRRYRALQKMIKDGEYFSEEEMKKRCPDLYEHYIGRFLTTEEKAEKLHARAAAHPTTLSGFFMEVIENRNDREELEENEAEEEEYDEDSEEEENNENPPEITEEEKEYLADEFKSRMYQHFLDGLDKKFDYKTVDENTEYDDLAQISRDVEDNYFDDEEPSDMTVDGDDAVKEDDDSEDELDKYMKNLEQAGKILQTTESCAPRKGGFDTG